MSRTCLLPKTISAETVSRIALLRIALIALKPLVRAVFKPLVVYCRGLVRL